MFTNNLPLPVYGKGPSNPPLPSCAIASSQSLLGCSSGFFRSQKGGSLGITRGLFVGLFVRLVVRLSDFTLPSARSPGLPRQYLLGKRLVPLRPLALEIPLYTVCAKDTRPCRTYLGVRLATEADAWPTYCRSLLLALSSSLKSCDHQCSCTLLVPLSARLRRPVKRTASLTPPGRLRRPLSIGKGGSPEKAT